MIRELISRRTCRYFYQAVPVGLDTLRELVDLARLSPSGHNAQPLKYLLSNEPDKNALIFTHIDLGGSRQLEGERPAAYIIILGDTEIAKSFGCNHGVAAQSIMLGAAEKGLGACIIANIKRDQLRQALSIPERYEILLVMALGKPKDVSVIEPIGPDGRTFPWRDEKNVRHVPKRSLDDVIIG